MCKVALRNYSWPVTVLLASLRGTMQPLFLYWFNCSPGTKDPVNTAQKHKQIHGPVLPLPYSFLCVLLCFSRRSSGDWKYCLGPLALGLCPLPQLLSTHLSFILHTTWVHTMTPAGCSWRWELTARPHFPRQLLPEPQHPLPEFFSFSSSPFSCLHLSNDPLSPMGTILACMGVGTTPGAGETSHEPSSWRKPILPLQQTLLVNNFSALTGSSCALPSLCWTGIHWTSLVSLTIAAVSSREPWRTASHSTPPTFAS